MKKQCARLLLWTLLQLILLTSCGYLMPSPDRPDPALNSSETGSTEPAATQVPTTPEPAPTEPPGPTGTTSIRLRAVGDIMMHSPQLTAGLQPDGTYNFNHFFTDIKPYLEDADFTLGNLETTISNDEKGYGGYPLFRTPAAILDALIYAGFNVITTANNHSFDGREFGVVYTIEKLEEYGIPYTGTARNQVERDRVLMLEKNDIRVAVLAYTYGTNGMEVTISRDKLPFMVNYIDRQLIEQDVLRARDAGADMIIACMHWGAEYLRQPGRFQLETTEFLASIGVDIILGSHPHVLQPMELKTVILEDGTEKEYFVIYSMGNFISNQQDQFKDSGIIVEIEIIKDYDRGTVGLGRIGYIPTWVHRFRRDGRSDYAVLPVAGFMDDVLTGTAGMRIQAVWRETTTHMGEDFEIITSAP